MTDDCRQLEALHSAWLDRALDPPQAASVERHVGTCPSCREQVTALQRTRALLGSLPPRRIPAGVLADVPAVASPGASSAGGTVGALRRGLPRTAAMFAAVAGLLSGAALSLADARSGPDTGVVQVPVDLFVADHLAQSMNRPVPSAIFIEAKR